MYFEYHVGGGGGIHEHAEARHRFNLIQGSFQVMTKSSIEPQEAPQTPFEDQQSSPGSQDRLIKQA